MQQHNADAPKAEAAQGEPGAYFVEGPSFPITLKAIATLLVAAVLLWGLFAVDDFFAAQTNLRTLGFLAAVLLVIGLYYWCILTSRTRIDDHCIRQRWLWTKEVRLNEISQVKLIYVPHLSWLLVPRLIVRTRGFGFTTFQIADERVLAAVQHLLRGPR